MGIKSDFSPECQKFVKKLFAFFSKEKATKKSIASFDRVYQKTSKISKSKLTLTLIDFGYTYKTIGDNRRVLYDQVSIKDQIF